METSSNPRFLDPTYVQFFLDNLGPLQPFTVIFQKRDGTQRKATGYLEPGGTRKSSPPMCTVDGWKSFRKDHVMYIASVRDANVGFDW